MLRIELTDFELEALTELVGETISSLHREGREKSPEYREYNHLYRKLVFANQPNPTTEK
jgi:hypothetical protein